MSLKNKLLEEIFKMSPAAAQEASTKAPSHELSCFDLRRPCLARLAVLAEALAVELSWHLSVPRRRPRPEIPRRERVHRAIGPPPPPPPLPPPPDGRGPAGRPGPGRPVVITAVGPPRDAGGRGAGWIQQLPVGGRLPPVSHSTRRP